MQDKCGKQVTCVEYSVRTGALLLIWLGVIVPVRQACAESDPYKGVKSCPEVTTVRPGFGNAFQGLVKNEDYSFSAEIPPGMIAWDGVGNNAPFHGFVIFLDQNLDSCIQFEIHVRIDDSEVLAHSGSARRGRLGDAPSWQYVRGVVPRSGRMVNIRTLFSFENGDLTSDGEILLVAPASKLLAARRAYQLFLASLAFHRQ